MMTLTYSKWLRTSWVAMVTPTDRPKSVRDRSVIERFCGVVCVFILPFWHFCWCRGFCHRTESDLFLFPYRCFNEEWMELNTSKEAGKITNSGLETFQESSGLVSIVSIRVYTFWYVCCCVTDYLSREFWLGMYSHYFDDKWSAYVYAIWNFWREF